MQLAPQVGGLRGGQGDLEAFLAGIAGGGNEILADLHTEERAEAFGCRLHLRQHFPDLGLGVRALHGDHAERGVAITTLGDGEVQTPILLAGGHPGEILGRRAGVDDDAEGGVVQVVDDEVVDHAASLVEHGGVERLAGRLQLVDVVGHQLAQEGFRIRADDVDGAHVGDIEHAAVGAHGMVLLDLRAIVDRHVPAAEIDHAGAGCAMNVIEYGFLRHISPLGEGVEQDSRNEKGASLEKLTPLSLVPERFVTESVTCPVGGWPGSVDPASLSREFDAAKRSFCLSGCGCVAPSATAFGWVQFSPVCGSDYTGLAARKARNPEATPDGNHPQMRTTCITEIVG
jgi:hypothetical protein